MAGRREALHDSFALAHRLMGVFRTVIQIATLAMFDARQDRALRRAVTGKFVGDEHARDVRTALRP